MYNAGRALPDVKAQKSIGGLPYTNNVSLTGYVKDLTADWQVVSPNAGVAALPHGMLQTADFVSVASTSANDALLGTGARIVSLTGVDEKYNAYQEIILMAGQTPVQTAQKMIPFEILILEFGANIDAATGDSVSAGTIYCGTGTFTAGVPAVPLVAIEPSSLDPNSRDAIFVVPDGKIALLRSLFVTADPIIVQNISVTVQLALRLFGFGKNQWFKTLPYHFDSAFIQILENLAPIPPRTQIQIRCKATLVRIKAVSVQADFELKDLR